MIQFGLFGSPSFSSSVCDLPVLSYPLLIPIHHVQSVLLHIIINTSEHHEDTFKGPSFLAFAAELSFGQAHTVCQEPTVQKCFCNKLSQPHQEPDVFSLSTWSSCCGELTSFREEEEEEGRFSAIAYHRLQGEDIIGGKQGVSLHLCPLVLKRVGEKGKAFLESGVHRALLEKILHPVWFLPLQPATQPRGETSHQTTE